MVDDLKTANQLDKFVVKDAEERLGLVPFRVPIAQKIHHQETQPAKLNELSRKKFNSLNDAGDQISRHVAEQFFRKMLVRLSF